MLVLVVIAAGCGSSPGAEAPAGQLHTQDAPSLRRAGAIDAANLGGSGDEEDAAVADGPADDVAAPEDARPPEDRRRQLDGSRAFDGGGRDGGHPARNCMAGATCGPNAYCERACMGGQIYRCTCTEGRFVCTGCIATDAGVPDAGSGAGFCAGNVTVQGRRCDHAGDVCHYATDGGQRLCACGDVGPQRQWICQ